MTLLETFRRLAEQIPDPLLLLGAAGRVVAANQSARRVLGADIEGRDLGELAEDGGDLRRYLSRCSGSGSRLPGTLRIRRGSESEILRCDGSALRLGADDSPLLLLQIRREREAVKRFRALNEQIAQLHGEIRRREEVERERERLLGLEREARASAEEASRLKDEFLATASHEFRTPLNAIKGWVHLLRSRAPDPELLSHGLAVIEKNVDLQAQLVEDLLDVSRIITGRMRLAVEPVDIAGVVRDAAEAVRPAAEAKNLRLQVIAAIPGPMVLGDRDRLVQVVWNLLVNAVKFTSKGGHIEALVRRTDSFVEIQVADDGEGIAPEVLPYVFDRFRQADASTTRRHGGLGLGLAIVRHLIELHGGQAVAESLGVGRGATFRVSIPVPLVDPARPDLSPATAAAGATAALPDLAGLRLLVVEDHEDSLQFLRRILASAGADVVPAQSAAEAFAEFQRLPPDAIVSDIQMPNEDGYTLIRRIRNLERESDRARTPAVAVTAYSSSRHRMQALLGGFQSFVAKPVDPSELLTVVASITGRL